MPKNILFIGGSLNQTTMMHQIAENMSEDRTFFTPFFDDSLLGIFSRCGLLDFSILGGQHRANTISYLNEKGLPIDYHGQSRDYDLIVTCTDLVVPRQILGKKIVLVQEGMMEPENTLYHMVRWLHLPRALANTAATGLSHAYRIFCVASQGYRDLFIKKGVRPEKIAVTGIPNFDNVEKYLKNDFPHRNFVLVATSSSREVFKWEDRKAFILKAVKIAAGRKLIFKLHPNEKVERAQQEIQAFAPGAIVYTTGNINHMIANCDVLITQTSSVTFIGLALKKEVHTELDLNQLKQLMPIQNEGTSAQKIADLCYQILNRSTLPSVSNLSRPAKRHSPGKVIEPI
jgi:hypothetical protein